MTPDTPAPAPLTRRELRARAKTSADGPPRRSEEVADPAGTRLAAPQLETGPEIVSAPEVSPADALFAETGDPAPDDDPAEGTEQTATHRWATPDAPPTALTWVDAAAVEAATADGALDAPTPDDDEPSLLAGVRTRRVNPAVAAPLCLLAFLGVGYAVSMAVWPLHAVTPRIAAADFEVRSADLAAVTWPAEGSAAIGIGGMDTTASDMVRAPIASLTKVVSALLVLDEMPLQLGESGPSYDFTWRDNRDYWRYLRDNQSALDVPVDGSLTQYQMLQGTLISSANNYIDRLAEEIWDSDSAFADAAETWLADRGLDGITVVTPSGRHEDNVATPAALIELAEKAMANPVIAEIVGMRTADLPGAGLIRNSNGLLADPGVTGVKTGTLRGDYNVLSAKEITIDGTTVHLYAAVLGQEDDDARQAVSRSLYAEVEQALQLQEPALDADTVVGEVRTVWGERVDVVTAADSSVVLWNGAVPTAQVDFDIDAQSAVGEAVGTISVSGPIDSVTQEVVLASDLPGPSIWWRLTHPLELLGLLKS